MKRGWKRKENPKEQQQKVWRWNGPLLIARDLGTGPASFSLPPFPPINNNTPQLPTVAVPLFAVSHTVLERWALYPAGEICKSEFVWSPSQMPDCSPEELLRHIQDSLTIDFCSSRAPEACQGPIAN